MTEKYPLNITIVPCVATEVTHNLVPLEGNIDTTVARYYENQPHHQPFLQKVFPMLQQRIQEMYPQIAFDMELLNDRELMNHFEFTEKEENDEMEFHPETADILRGYYEKHSKGEPERRVSLAFWGIYRLWSHRLEEIGTPNMWTNTLREVFKHTRKNREIIQDHYIQSFGHELGHTLGLTHHEGQEECTMRKAEEERLCQPCHAKVNRYIASHRK